MHMNGNGKGITRTRIPIQRELDSKDQRIRRVTPREGIIAILESRPPIDEEILAPPILDKIELVKKEDRVVGLRQELPDREIIWSLEHEGYFRTIPKLGANGDPNIYYAGFQEAVRRVSLENKEIGDFIMEHPEFNERFRSIQI